MKINLSDENLFKDDRLLLDKNVNFIFGKNGTGKSTICDLIWKQASDEFDVRIFQGFESVLGEEKKLNAVILGEENKNINNKIKKLEMEISKINEEIEVLSKTINPQMDKEVNLFYKLQKVQKDMGNKEKEIDKFFINAARDISRLQHGKLVDNPRSYNKNDFKSEIEKAKRLNDDEIKKYTNILSSEKRLAKNLSLPKIDFSQYLNVVNNILNTKVEEKIIIEELKNNHEKTNFAQQGLDLHHKGEKCAFCGNFITGERIERLHSYFSADEVKSFKHKIKEEISCIDNEIEQLQNIEFDINVFYPDYIELASQIEKELEEIVKIQIEFMETLHESLENKQKNLFDESKSLDITVPVIFDNIEDRIKSLIKDNNNFANNLSKNQEVARDKLRYNEICKYINEFKLDVKNAELLLLQKIENTARLEVERQEKIINAKDEERSKRKQEIICLLQETKNTKKLADNINLRLKSSVSFELCRIEEGGREFYEIKDMYGVTRHINQLSTGEKNIIAFLYFVEKLYELVEVNKSKIIVFDDPMNSNDDTMQYLIIDELQKIMKRCQKNSNEDKFVLLTHNVFFYLNSSHDIKIQRNPNKDPYNENNFYKLLSDKKQSTIIRIQNKNNDFKTNYEALWHELAFLYNENKPEMMLNPIRRIIETFIVFNGKEDFYKDNKNAKNLFNTNSHYFPDLEADVNGKTREEILAMLEQCFKNNNSDNHYRKHWSNANKCFEKK